MIRAPAAHHAGGAHRGQEAQADHAELQQHLARGGRGQKRLDDAAVSAAHGNPSRSSSGIEIGYQLALELHDQVLEHQLALLETFELQLIDMDIHRQARDDLIQIAMFDAQLPQFLNVAEQVAVDVVFLIAHSFDRPVTVGRLAPLPGPLRCGLRYNPRRAVIGIIRSGSLAKRPSGRHGNPGSWKSEPIEPASSKRRASVAARSASPGPMPARLTSRPTPPAALNCSTSVRSTPLDTW